MLFFMVLWKLKECDPHSFDPSLPRNPLIMNSNFTLWGVVPSGCVKHYRITGLSIHRGRDSPMSFLLCNQVNCDLYLKHLYFSFAKQVKGLIWVNWMWLDHEQKWIIMSKVNAMQWMFLIIMYTTRSFLGRVALKHLRQISSNEQHNPEHKTNGVIKLLNAPLEWYLNVSCTICVCFHTIHNGKWTSWRPAIM